MTKLKALSEKLAALKTEMVDETKKVFNETVKEIFDKYPKLEAFAWTQFTPHFNDGDACTFSAHTDYPDLVWDGTEHEGVDEYSFRDGGTAPKAIAPCLHDIQEMFQCMDQESLKSVFGDHCKVIAKRGGVEVEEYEHD